MNAGRTVKVNLTEKEREKAGLTAENIRIQLAKDRKRLEFGKDAIQEKQKAWLMSNGKLWFEFASDHVGREIQRCKQNLHRKCKEEIDELERKLQVAAERVTNLSQKLKHERRIKTEEFETRCSKYGCLRWWRGAAIALIANLEEDVEEAVALESSLRNQIRNAKQSEINGHKDLQRQEEEAIKMLRSDVGSDILDGKIPDAIEMPFVSDSESSEGSAANSDLDIIQDDISEHSEDAVDVGSISSSEPSSL